MPSPTALPTTAPTSSRSETTPSCRARQPSHTSTPPYPYRHLLTWPQPPPAIRPRVGLPRNTWILRQTLECRIIDAASWDEWPPSARTPRLPHPDRRRQRTARCTGGGNLSGDLRQATLIPLCNTAMLEKLLGAGAVIAFAALGIHEFVAKEASTCRTVLTLQPDGSYQVQCNHISCEECSITGECALSTYINDLGWIAKACKCRGSGSPPPWFSACTTEIYKGLGGVFRIRCLKDCDCPTATPNCDNGLSPFPPPIGFPTVYCDCRP